MIPNKILIIVEKAPISRKRVKLSDLTNVKLLSVFLMITQIMITENIQKTNVITKYLISVRILYHELIAYILRAIIMNNAAAKLWSALVISLSQPIILAKRESLYRIKLRSANIQRKNIGKIGQLSGQQQKSEPSNYMSITDFKPLSSVYSSVKIFEEDFQSINYQTKKQARPTYREENNQYCRLEDWMVAKKAKSISIFQYPKSEFCHKKINTYTPEALKSIKAFTFEQFCGTNLKKKKLFGIFKEKNTLSYKKGPIENSLSHVAETKIQMAIDLWQYLLKAGSEQPGPFPIVFYVWKFIKIVFQQMEDLWEQAYFQIIKQLSSKKKIYYQIFACMSATIQPSTRMYPALLNFVYEQSMQPQLQMYSEHLSYIFFSLIKNFSNSRKAQPCMFQIACYMNLRKIPVLISFPLQNTFFIESYSTVDQILTQLIELYGLNRNTSYLLNIEGVLLQKGQILDGLNSCRKYYEDWDHWETFEKFQGFNAFIVIKNMLEMHSCEQNYLIMYNYLINQYRRGLFAVTNKIAFEIGGLIIASQVGIQQSYQFSLAKYLPKRRYICGLELTTKQKMQQLILKQYTLFKGTKKQARDKTLKLLSKSKAYLTHFFFCNIFIGEQEYSQAWVGIKSESLLVVQPKSSRIMMHVRYQNIKKWGKSSSQLCLHIDNVGQLHIESYIIQVLVSIFQNYIQYLREQLLILK